MKLRLIGSALLLGLTVVIASAFKMRESDRPAGSVAARSVVTPEFTAYWSQGKGEVNTYELEQARYGEMRRGEAVLIFVTEDFLAGKQVKLESPPDGRAWLPVLKLNFTKTFATGVYPYSMMTSVFSPIEALQHPNAIKVSASAQEWCGHTFTQLNLREKGYDVETRSYFEREGDENFALDAVTLEDEIWTLIRLAPSALPVGRIRMIPGTMASRLRHIRLKAEHALAVMETLPADSTGAAMSRYSIEYGNDERILSIDFRTAFPHEIISWSETYLDGFGPNAQRLTTRARRTSSIKSDYWNRNSNAHAR